MEPRETPHAPKASRLVSGCSPSAAGSTRIPRNSATAPSAIIQLPVRDDILQYLLGEEKDTRCIRVANKCEHSEFSGPTPDDESHRLGQIRLPVTEVTCLGLLRNSNILAVWRLPHSWCVRKENRYRCLARFFRN